MQLNAAAPDLNVIPNGCHLSDCLNLVLRIRILRFWAIRTSDLTDQDSYLVLTDLDPGGPITYGSGSATLPLSMKCSGRCWRTTTTDEPWTGGEWESSCTRWWWVLNNEHLSRIRIVGNWSAHIFSSIEQVGMSRVFLCVQMNEWEGAFFNDSLVSHLRCAEKNEIS